MQSEGKYGELSLTQSTRDQKSKLELSVKMNMKKGHFTFNYVMKVFKICSPVSA